MEPLIAKIGVKPQFPLKGNHQITHFYLETEPCWIGQDFLLRIVANTERGDETFLKKIKPYDLLEIEYFPILPMRFQVNPLRSVQLYWAKNSSVDLLSENIIDSTIVNATVKIFYT